jgi:hypothetical protein
MAMWIACDILYYNDSEMHEEKGRIGIDYTMEKLPHVFYFYRWDFYKSIEGLHKFRTIP